MKEHCEHNILFIYFIFSLICCRFFFFENLFFFCHFMCFFILFELPNFFFELFHVDFLDVF